MQKVFERDNNKKYKSDNMKTIGKNLNLHLIKQQ